MKLAVTAVLWPGADTAQVVDLLTQVVVGKIYVTILLAAKIVGMTRTTKSLFLSGPSMAIQGPAEQEWTTVTLQTGGAQQNTDLPCFMRTMNDSPGWEG